MEDVKEEFCGVCAVALTSTLAAGAVGASRISTKGSVDTDRKIAGISFIIAIVSFGVFLYWYNYKPECASKGSSCSIEE